MSLSLPHYRFMLKEQRKTVVRQLLEEGIASREADGWDQPHELLTVCVHDLGLDSSGENRAYMLQARPFPLPVGSFPGDGVHEKVASLLESLYALRQQGQSLVSLGPPHFAGIALLAESWLSIRSGPLAAALADAPMPSQDPQRQEALTVAFADLSGNLCDGVRIRGEQEATVRDVEDMSLEALRHMLEVTRLPAPMIGLGALLGDADVPLRVQQAIADEGV